MKSFCSRFALAFIGLTLSACAVAQSYPTRAIRLIVPFAPGGGSDAIARMLADKMGPELGQSVVVENKPGASSIIGVDATAKAPADGYTLVMANSSITSNPWLYKLPYDLQADLAAVTMIAKAPQLLVANPKAPFKTVGELVSYAKANPGMATIGTAGAGQISHLAAEVLQHAGGIDALLIHYKGTGNSLNDLLGGQIMLSFGTAPGLIPHVKSGKLVALGSSGPERLASLPSVPTVAETIPGFELMNWFGIFAPAGTPAAVVEKLHAVVRHAIADPKVQARLSEEGFTPVGNSPAEFDQIVRHDLNYWKDVIQKYNIKIE